ncbi:Acyl-CoA N-acyltransferase [Penicillium occitanis (nom. inval.)]|nr:Acyl-CoA N-acyltransferase [Penicillium occitanis (nom. inval.)]PCG98808.1 hypothetical protein PENOC_061280 [Penicillium occitanis (nom. inval.)]
MPGVHEDIGSEVIPNPQEYAGTICPRQFTLRDRVTVATLVPFISVAQVPHGLLGYLSDQLNKEIEKGDTYTMIDPIPLEKFAPWWFANIGAIMLLGDIQDVHDVQLMEHNGTDWTKVCLGSFNIRPNYPGRSSHVCNGMFLVTDASRNKGVGKLMGEGFLEWAPRLVRCPPSGWRTSLIILLQGYTYCVFNLVYESNIASCRMWDSLGFKRIGRVPGAGHLKSYPGQLVDGIIYGRDLNVEGDESITQERFDKIRYYLKHAKYPRGADRAEKSRLRSAATHYKLIGGEDGEPERLMLKDKEVVSDPQQQYEIARQVHLEQHGGINKTTATVALKYHWVRIKETVSRVIRDCPKCKEASKAPPVLNGGRTSEPPSIKPISEIETAVTNSLISHTEHLMADATHVHASPFTSTHTTEVHTIGDDSLPDYTHLPLDPQMIDMNGHLSRFQHHHSMSTGYDQSHGLPHAVFEDELRAHHHNEYQSMVTDDSEAEALQRDALNLVNTQLTDSQHEQEMLSRYVDRSDDELDFT